MLRHHKLTVLFILAVGLVWAPYSTPRVSASASYANRTIGSIGWILTFNLEQDIAARLSADFHFLLKFQNSTAAYDLAGTVPVDCGPRQQAGRPQHCSIPDMATLILEASGGKTNIRQMQIPRGTLEACGQITRAARTKSSTQRVDILSANSSQLYGLSLADRALVLSHARRETTILIPEGTSHFEMSLPDTTLTAPANHTLDILVELPGVYALDQLTVVDPGAFAHLHEQACSV